METGEREPLVHLDVNGKFMLLISQVDWNHSQNQKLVPSTSGYKQGEKLVHTIGIK